MNCVIKRLTMQTDGAEREKVIKQAPGWCLSLLTFTDVCFPATAGRRFSFLGPLPMSELLPKVREQLQGHDAVRFSALLHSSEANSHFRRSAGICDILEQRKAANGDAADLVCCLGPSAPQIQSLRCSAVPAAKDKALFLVFFLASHPTSLGLPRLAAGVQMCGN